MHRQVWDSIERRFDTHDAATAQLRRRITAAAAAAADQFLFTITMLKRIATSMAIYPETSEPAVAANRTSPLKKAGLAVAASGRMDALAMEAAQHMRDRHPEPPTKILVRSLHRQQKNLFHWSTLLVIALASGETALMLYGMPYFEAEDIADGSPLMSDDTKLAAGNVVGVIGGLQVFLLAFRLNVCYARWWEGRCLWGLLIFAAIHTCQQGNAWIRDKALAKRFTHMVVVFAWASKAQLRGNSLGDAVEEGADLVSRGLLEKAELEQITSQGGWQPYYCLDVLRAVMNEAWRREGATALSCDATRQAAFLALESLYKELAKAIGGSIRVKATGLPILYDDFLHLLMVCFFVAAPITWAEDAKWATPVICAVVYTVLRTLMVLGSDLEDPFGADRTDHPLERFCKVVEAQCGVVLERHEAAAFAPLHLPPSARSLGVNKAWSSTLSMSAAK